MDVSERKRILKEEALKYMRDAQRCLDASHIVPGQGQKPEIHRSYRDEGNLEEYEYYLYQDEIELAWGALESTAHYSPNKDCWHLLAMAAVLVYEQNPAFTYFVENLKQRIARDENLKKALQNVENAIDEDHPLLTYDLFRVIDSK